MVLALGLVAALWAQTPTASGASARDAVAGRVFTLAALPNTSGSLTVAPDGTVWDARGWRLRPGDLQPRRIIQRSGVLDVAALRDGSVIFSQGSLVWRRTPDGRTRVVAGRRTSAPVAALGRDGGRAVETELCGVGAVAALPDGGFREP